MYVWGEWCEFPAYRAGPVMIFFEAGSAAKAMQRQKKGLVKRMCQASRSAT